MQTKTKSKNNIRPNKDVCEKCKSHGFCLAEDGEENYQCWKIVWLPKHKDDIDS